MKRIQTTKRARILIVDDHPAMRKLLSSRIGRQADLEVCGEAADISEALRLVADTQPDLAVVDISLKTGSGIDLIKRIKDHNDNVRMLVWSMYGESSYAERALRAGALGYISKNQEMVEIIEAIRRVLEGDVYLSNTMAKKLLHRAVGGDREEVTRDPLDALTDRELEVFRLIGQAVKTTEIAEQLHLSVKTVKTYRNRIRQKLSLHGRVGLAHYATQWMLENG